MGRKRVNRKKLLHTFLFSIFCVFGLTVAYAALSTTLNISGSAIINQSSWSFLIEEYSFSDYYNDMGFNDACIYIECKDNYMFAGNAKISQKPSVNGTSITNASIEVSVPGEGVGFLYKFTNNGTIPAKLESINQYTPTYTSLNNNSNDIVWSQNNFGYDFSLFFLTPDTDFNYLNVGDVICPGETSYFGVEFGVDDDATTVPSGAITISNLGVDYNFVQADMSVCS
jgi:hypothetical protein